MTKLALKAAPTFSVKVGVPVAGGASVDVLMTFRHRTRTQLDEFVKSRTDKSDTVTFMDMVQGWDLEDEFSESSVNELIENYIGVAVATYEVYLAELIKAKVKN